jgi:hypothetical protein
MKESFSRNTIKISDIGMTGIRLLVVVNIVNRDIYTSYQIKHKNKQCSKNDFLKNDFSKNDFLKNDFSKMTV